MPVSHYPRLHCSNLRQPFESYVVEDTILNLHSWSALGFCRRSSPDE